MAAASLSVRICDVARAFGVSWSTAKRAVKRRDGFDFGSLEADPTWINFVEATYGEQKHD